MELEEGILHALEGEAILFVGAGFSTGAFNVLNEPMKRSNELIELLASRLESDESMGLTDVSEEFIEIHGADQLINLLKEEFTASKVADHHENILRVPWRRIYTTNYDDVIEKAGSNVSKKVTPIVPEVGSSKVDLSSLCAIHFNGHVDRIDEETLKEELKLTWSSYGAASIQDSAWMGEFRSDLRLAKSVFFIGYSLGDLDIQRAVDAYDGLKEKCFFVLPSGAENRSGRKLALRGRVIKAGVEEISFIFKSAQEDFVPREDDLFSWITIDRYANDEGKRIPDSRDVYDMFLLGNQQDQFIAGSMNNSYSYVLKRDVVDQLAQRLERLGSLFLVSEIGNGKSILGLQLLHMMAERGYESYVYRGRDDRGLLELTNFMSIQNKKMVLMIDDYSSRMYETIYALNHRMTNVKILLICRTSLHETASYRLADACSDLLINQHDADELTESDLRGLVRLMDEYGLWGELGGLSQRRKYLRLKDDCKGEFAAVLSDTFNAPQIQRRFHDIFTTLKERKQFHEVIISILALTILQIPINMDILRDYWGEETMSAKFSKDPGINQICDVRRGSVKLRSAIAARFMIRAIEHHEDLVDVLVKMAAESSRRHGVSVLHREVIYKMSQLSFLGSLLPDLVEERRVNLAISFYERTKNLGFYKVNIHFWFQYGMTMLAVGRLDLAERYFDYTYALIGSNPGYESKQMDNHYARLLIELARTSDNTAVAMEKIRAAQRILLRQMRRERLHYPYKVGAQMADAYIAHESEWSKEEKEEFARFAEAVLARISASSASLQDNRSVRQCWDSMRLIQEAVSSPRTSMPSQDASNAAL